MNIPCVPMFSLPPALTSALGDVGGASLYRVPSLGDAGGDAGGLVSTGGSVSCPVPRCVRGASPASELPLTRAVGGKSRGGSSRGSRCSVQAPVNGTKAPTSALGLHRANALEEQLKEQELRACEMVLEETRKQKELLCKMEREKSIEIENLQAR